MSERDELDERSEEHDLGRLTRDEGLDGAPPTPASSPHWLSRMIPLEVDGTTSLDLEHQLVYANVSKALFGSGATLEIGKYVIERRIGEGGMGEVYLCRDLELDRAVAVKRVIGRASARARERLRREAQALATLNHDNVVTVYDSGEHEGRLFVVMEYVEGETLRGWIARPRVWTTVLDTLIAAGRGLAAAHAAGIVHRDFKPDNVLISRAGAVRVADFGLALREAELRAEEREAGPEGDERLGTLETRPGTSSSFTSSAQGRRLSAVGAVLGTREYMPLEQLLGEEVDARSDQFAFCMTLYEALWGEYPFELGRHGERTQQLRAPPRRPRDHLAVFRVLRRGLDPDANQRWPDMTSLLDALAGIPRRRRAVAVAAVGVPLLVLCGLGLFLTAGAEDTAPEICEAVAAELGGVWDAPVQAHIETHASSLSSPHSVVSGDRLSAGLDAWAQAWVPERAAVCEAVEASSSPTHRARARLRCLDRQRRRVATITAGVLDGDADTLAHALVAVAELGDPGACADDPRGLDLDPPPAAIEASVAELRAELERASQLRGLAQPEAALRSFALLRPRVEALDYGPLSAELHAELGRAHEDHGQPELAADAYDRALDLAERHRHEHLAAELALQRAELDVFELHDLDGAQLRYEQAVRYASRLPDDPDRVAGLAFGQGRIALALQDHEAAERETRAALEIAGPGASRRPKYLSGLAEILEAAGHRPAALDARRRAYESAVELWGPDHPRVARPMANYGLALGSEDHEGQGLRRRAAEIAWATSSPRERAWADLQAAAVALDQGRVADARALLGRPLPASAAPSLTRGHTLALLASVEAETGLLDQAIAHADDALDQYTHVVSLSEGRAATRRALDTQAWLANVLIVRARAGDLARARTLLAELVERVEDHPSDAALAHLGLAELALLAGQLDEADAELRACARGREELGVDDSLAHALLRALVDLRRGSPSAQASADTFGELLLLAPDRRAELSTWLDLRAGERRQLDL